MRDTAVHDEIIVDVVIAGREFRREDASINQSEPLGGSQDFWLDIPVGCGDPWPLEGIRISPNFWEKVLKKLIGTQKQQKAGER